MLDDFYRGDHLHFDFEFVDEDGDAVSIDGGSIWFTVKELDDNSDNDDNAVIQVVVTDHTDVDAGTSEMDVDKFMTDVNPKKYKYDFQYVTVTNRPTTLDSGVVRVKGDVTRRWAANSVDVELFLLELTGDATCE